MPIGCSFPSFSISAQHIQAFLLRTITYKSWYFKCKKMYFKYRIGTSKFKLQNCTRVVLLVCGEDREYIIAFEGPILVRTSLYQLVRTSPYHQACKGNALRRQRNIKSTFIQRQILSQPNLSLSTLV